ncbi:unnamed protein product [Camellia sinensis]
MSAILAVKLSKRLGFGMREKLHLMGMHVEGKVLIGVKFHRHWPFLGLLRVCFVEPPYFQMTVKPIFTHGLHVTELPGIAGWLDKLLAVAFEQTLVELAEVPGNVDMVIFPNYWNSTIWSNFLEELLSLMVQQNRLMRSDRKVLPSFLTSLLGSSCHSLLVPQTIGQRFSQSIKNDILVFILGFALNPSAYAKLIC